MEELGINSGSSIKSTYESQDVTVDDIIRTHTTILENRIPHHLETEKKTFATRVLDTKTQDLLQVPIRAPLLRSPN